MDSATELPQLQIWRADDMEGETLYQRVEGSSTDYEIINIGSTTTFINQEISFRTGDILAVRSSERAVLGSILLSPNSYGSSGSGSEPEDLVLKHESAIEISLLIGEGIFAILSVIFFI